MVAFNNTLVRFFELPDFGNFMLSTKHVKYIYLGFHYTSIDKSVDKLHIYRIFTSMDLFTLVYIGA